MSYEGYYRHKRYPGVAFCVVGHPQVWAPYTYEETDPETGNTYEAQSGDGEYQDDTSRVLAVMVGDDYKHNCDPDDLTPLPREEFCGECGQIGCRHDGYDRE